MTETQKLALVLAEKTVAYYEALNSNWSDKKQQERQAYNEMVDAQNQMAWAASREAETLV